MRRFTLERATNLTVIFTCVGLLSWRFIFQPTNQDRAGASPPPIPTQLLPIDLDTVDGRLSAPVAIVEFADFECPFCGQFARDALPQLRAKYVDTGKVLLNFRHFPLTAIHPLAMAASRLVACAAARQHFLRAYEELYQSSAPLDSGRLKTLADDFGLSPVETGQCLNGHDAQQVDLDVTLGKSLKVSATPTFFIGLVQKDGIRISHVFVGTLQVSDLSHAIDPLLPKASATLLPPLSVPAQQ